MEPMLAYVRSTMFHWQLLKMLYNSLGGHMSVSWNQTPEMVAFPQVL